MKTPTVHATPDSLPRPAARPPGFTLVELMAVMAVIAILLSIAAVGIQNIDRGQATTTAVAVTEALFDEARSAAIGRGTRSRLLIHAELNDDDPTDRNRYLTYMAVAVSETDEDGKDMDRWRVVTRGTQLPSGVYFSPEESLEASEYIKVGKFGETFIPLPGSEVNKRVYYFEFNSEGVCVDSETVAAGAENPETGAAVVLIGGARRKGQEEAQMRKNNKVGFVVWRNGRTSLFRSPEQIEEEE